MFDLKERICYAGFDTKACEDIVGHGRNYCFVMDGASGLGGNQIVDPVSDSAWMVTKVRDGLCRLLDRDDPRPTRELLLEVMAGIRQEYLGALERLGVSAPVDSPSAGMALFRQRDNKLEFFGMGDCVGVAILPDGSGFYALDENLPALDQQVIEEMIALHRRTGISIKEARQVCNPQLLHNRGLRNKPGGYCVLDLLADDGIYNAREAVWELTAPVQVGAFSDGLAQLTEVFGQYPDYITLFAAMQQEGAEELFRRLCALQDADPELAQYPRFKHRDDTCALWGSFTPA